jgi:hypothetical protein
MRSFRLALCCALVLSSTFAQSDRGNITGTITDPAGAVVAGAMVEAKKADTGTVYQAASTSTGNYTLPQLPAGTYELTVTVAGFKKYIRSNVDVGVAQTVRIDAPLEVGATTESVTVSTEAPMLKTESGEISYNIAYDKVNSLPIVTLGGGSAFLGNIRNPLAVITLLPGAQFSNDNTLRINGMPSSSQSIRVEGQDATNGIWRQQNQNTQTGIEAVQEVAIQTSNFAAEYGQAGGGFINYTMKSGTNNFHGGAFDQYVNEALNAGTPFTDAGTTNSLKRGQHLRNPIRQNDYGFTLGGPVWLPKVYDGHDKTFFFFSFEQFRQSLVIRTGVSTVPTAAYRSGDFSSALGIPLSLAGQPAVDPLGRSVTQNAVYDPTTTRVAPDGTTIRDPFPGNRIPIARMDPVAAKVQALLPDPLGPGAAGKVNNYAIPAYSNFRHSTLPSIKLDHNLSSNVKISGFYSQIHQVSPGNNGYTQVFSPIQPQDTLSQTIRVNYDQTITPTLLLHLGAGFLHTNLPVPAPKYDQSQLWSSPTQRFDLQAFPNIIGMNDIFQGGNSVGLGIAFGAEYIKDIKPTATASLTWVKGNHTLKFGGEMVIDGIPTRNYTRANGTLGFAAQQSGIGTWENGKALNAFTGFPYASFFLGTTNSMNVTPVADTRLGNHALAGYVQDTWKVTRKLTLDYGLRYDYVTELKEQYGRMSNAAFHLPNPAASGRPGTQIYEGYGGGRCDCRFQTNYPFAIGPRLGMAYQIDSKTVFRAGAGLAYGSAPNDAFLSYSVNDFLQLAPSYSSAVSQLADGNIFAPGNRFGNKPAVYPDFTQRFPLETSPGFRPPTSVFISIDRNAGRPPRIFQWSVGLQREVMRNLVVEAAYVGNRGAWWTAPLLSTYNYNALTIEGLKSQYGLDLANSQADRNLMLTQINSPLVLNDPRFAFLRNTASVYSGFPATQPLNQALRPYPQWLGIPPFLGPPLGTTWYDSLQAKVTKRYSHGLTMDVAFTWQKELTLGVNSDTSYLTPNPPFINDVFNYKQNKQISGFSRPLMTVISFYYTTPGFNGSNTGMKALSWGLRDWTFGGALRYQSGALIRVPASNNQLLNQLARGPSNNPALWGGGTTFVNNVSGQARLLVDPNCHCFDPTTTRVLNAGAWSDAAPGQWGTAAPYYNDYRWQRQPAESLSIGRTFQLAKEGKVNLNVRAEFQNVFNRVFYSTPTANNIAAPTSPNGFGGFNGFGFINNVNGFGTSPRAGQMVARLRF